jgi:hypothetical protein
MTFTDRHRRLIGDIEIPGVDANEDDDDPLPGVVPVIAYDIEIPGVDVEGTEAQDAVPAPQVEIDDLDISHDDPAPIEVAPTQDETPVPVALPAQAPELRISTRARSQMLIHQVRLVHKYPISPWEMIHPPGGDNTAHI